LKPTFSFLQPVRSRSRISSVGHHFGAVVAHVAELVHLLGIALTQDAALPDGKGRIVAYGSVHLVHHVAELVHPGDVPQLRGGKALQSALSSGSFRAQAARLTRSLPLAVP
jgi:hypothetical protein